jgi:hypothetical protein
MKCTELGESFTANFHDVVNKLQMIGAPICVFFIEYLTKNHIILQVSKKGMGKINPRLRRHLSKVLFGMIIKNLITNISFFCCGN